LNENKRFFKQFSKKVFPELANTYCDIIKSLKIDCIPTYVGTSLKGQTGIAGVVFWLMPKCQKSEAPKAIVLSIYLKLLTWTTRFFYMNNFLKRRKTCLAYLCKLSK
jgi:hypothetical protein